jgi:acetylornithine deacetylase/succinyl-diaminopimelate desuccinylase-like protein
LQAPAKSTILIYGHFDVQPVDPLERWIQPPFAPAVRDHRIYARGASDDKGNMLIPILAVEAMLKTQGSLPVNLKFFFEGQEEIGSPQLPEFISSHRQLLACDLVLSADGGQWDENQPALITGSRGLAGMQIEVCGASRDVHSGTYGGTFQNPIHALSRLITTMHSPEGQILVEGFFDSVRALSDSDRSQMHTIPYNDKDYKDLLGVKELFGEPGYSTYERTWVRPTLELNGIWGGFQGEGLKTVIPSRAYAKITCRLVPDQAPDKIVELVKSHVANHCPPGVTVELQKLPGNAEPYLIPLHHPGNQAARTVLRALYGKDPYVVRMGGTIPVCGIFLKELDAYTVIFAFGLNDENIHAPNEFLRVGSLDRGQSAYGMILTELGNWNRRVRK